MTQAKRAAKIAAITATTIYALLAFVLWDANVAAWPQEYRAAMMFLSAVITFFIWVMGPPEGARIGEKTSASPPAPTPTKPAPPSK